MKKKLIIGIILFTIIFGVIINNGKDIIYRGENDGEIEFNNYDGDYLG